jgi:protein-S-isoprenylcysteine O-methyltransferase Ste14
LKRLRLRPATDLPARATVCVLFALLSVNLFGEWMRTGHVTGLLLLASELLVVVFTVVRRRASSVDRSTLAAVVTAISLVGPPLLRASTEPGLLPDAATAVISGLGLIVVVIGKMTLGRSFGLVPANRGVVVAGPYAFVRHPIYTGYLITHAAFLLAHPSALNAAIVAITDVALVIRALVEERVLRGDAMYRSYCRRVSWHLVPGLF